MVIEIERTRSLDVPFAPDQLYGAIYGGESKAHKFIITAMRDGTEATLSGTVTAKFLRADNVCVALTGTIEGGKACVVLGDECYATPGRFVLTIFVASGEENLCVYAAIGTTNRTDGTSTVDGGNIIPSVSDLIAQIDAAVATIPASYSDLMGSVAGTYSASNTYAVGDYVWYDGVLYRCTTAISTAESWTAAHWSRAVLGEDTSALKSAIGELDDLTTTDKDSVVDAINEVKSAIDEVEDDISDLQSGKVNKPVTSPNGISGQFLKTNGDGTTTWDDPISEPVSEAVADWLDEHPEATTTVEDFSLTANKLVKGTLGYVIPQQFGAKGDGVTDDSLAMKECITFARENNYAVFLPQGTYIVRHGQLAQTISDGQSIIIIGSGQNSIVKRMDDSLPEYQGSAVWAQMFTIVISPETNPAHDVIFANFCIDSNRRSQSNATDGYTHEASMDISIRNASGLTEDGQYLDRFIIENMRFYDPVADCVNVSGSSQIKIKHITIDKMIASDRHGTRSDIGFTACPIDDTIISNCTCGSIHFEFNYRPIYDELTWFKITNCTFDYVSLASRIQLIMLGCTINKSLILEALQFARIDNCAIKLTVRSNYIRNVAYQDYFSEIFIENTIIISTLVGDSATSLSVREGLNTTFTNCQFLYEGELNIDADEDGVYDHVSGCAVSRPNASPGMLTMDGCCVDKKFNVYANPYASSATFKNCIFETLYGVQSSTVAGSSNEVVFNFENVRLADTCKSFFLGYTLSRPIELNGEIECSLDNFDIRIQPGAVDPRPYLVNNCVLNINRKCLIDVPFTLDNIKEYFSLNTYSNNRQMLLFRNDTFIYDGDNPTSLPSKWKVTENKYLYVNDGLHTYEPLNKCIIAEYSSYGSVLSRPNCLLNPGYEYFDTSLKRVLSWDGEKWVNSDGTTALSYSAQDSIAVRVETDITENPIDELNVGFLANQSGSGDPSPDNIRPFTGLTGLTLYQTGENLLTTPIRIVKGAKTDYTSGKIIGDNYLSLFVYPVPKDSIYVEKPSSSGIYYGFSDNPNLEKNDSIEDAKDYFRYGLNILAENSRAYLYVTGGLNATNSVASATYGSASAETLEPGTGNNIEVAFSENDTVFYGGYVNVLTSELVVTHGHIASYNGETLPGKWLSSMDVYAEDTTPTTGAEVIYELAEPTTTQLETIDFSLLTGVNTLWSDGNGNVKVAYWYH